MESDLKKPIIIAFTGPLGSGKTTFATLLETYGFTRVRFAATLKEMLVTFGLSRDQVDGSKKNVPIAALGGVTPRHLMQTLGTEWGRNLVHPNIWAIITAEKIRTLASEQVPAGDTATVVHDQFVIDDLRYLNEYEALAGLGFALKVIQIDRQAAITGKASEAHSSEQDWKRIPFDAVLDNNGSLSSAYFDLGQIVGRIWRDVK